MCAGLFGFCSFFFFFFFFVVLGYGCVGSERSPSTTAADHSRFQLRGGLAGPWHGGGVAVHPPPPTPPPQLMRELAECWRTTLGGGDRSAPTGPAVDTDGRDLPINAGDKADWRPCTTPRAARVAQLTA